MSAFFHKSRETELDVSADRLMVYNELKSQDAIRHNYCSSDVHIVDLLFAICAESLPVHVFVCVCL